MQQLFVGSETAHVLRGGPLGKHVEGFVEALRSAGYEPRSIEAKVLIVAQLGRWLAGRGRGARDLDEDRVAEFLRLRRRRYRSHGAQVTLLQLVRHLRTTGVLAPAVVSVKRGTVALIEEQYATYLREERGLAHATLINYLAPVDRFLLDRFGKEPVRLGQLAARDVTQFVLRRAHTMSPGRAKLLVTALRSFLRFVFVRGETPIDLTPSVPTVADWRLAKLPKFIPAEDVQRLLRACDRRTATGRRDYAVLLLLARLGLRASEVVQMTLEDIDWAAGELMVRGKGARHDRLPLPADVGNAVVQYLRRDRPHCPSRRVFICAKAPRQGFKGPSTVCTIVRRAIASAGLRTPSRGAHLLRHSLATELLRRGGSLAEIGELLRHRSPDTTALYAKVDLGALREVAQPWPWGEA
ncbi:MAG TPA: site-specific integrase [Burkholderiales bacterium]|nr:site-specific integrase [Burkholderiales bacterium]